MQISTKISTQIVLSQDELKEAAIDYVKARTEVPADATFEVDFADDQKGDLTAIIDITGTTLVAADKPKPTRPRATPKPKDEPKDGTKEEEPVVEAQGEPEPEPALRTDPENRQDPNNPDPPSEEEPPFETEKPVEKVEVKPTSKIFPDTTTSAPTPPKAEPDPAVNVKSLFANLSKPTN